MTYTNKKTTALISVIIPVYKVESSIERCIQSILDQNDMNLEIVLVNDGTPDNSARIATRYVEAYSNVHIIHQENQGLSAARNTGIKHAKGERLLFVDSDDYLLEGVLAKYRDIEATMNPDVFVMNHLRIQENGTLEKESIEALVENRDTVLNYMMTLSGVDFYAWNKIINRSLLTEDQFPVGKLYEDLNATYDYMMRAKQVYFTTMAGYAYVEHSESIVASSFNGRQYDLVTECLRLYHKIRQDSPVNSDKALQKLALCYLSIGQAIYLSLATENRAIAKKFLKRLRKDIRANMGVFKRLIQIDPIKMMALVLLNTNIHGFGQMWRVLSKRKKAKQ